MANLTVPARFDPHVAHPARVYAYWLGSKDHFPADRKAAEEVAAHRPQVAAGARANRAFLARVVRYLAGQRGVRQFLDIGPGLPAPLATHEVAQAVAPDSRVVYIDNDPLVMVHARALLTSKTGGTCEHVDGDLRDPDTIVREAAKTLDFTQPTAVILVAVLHFLADADEPAGVVEILADALAPGSFVAISHLTADFAPDQVGAVIRLRPGVTFHSGKPLTASDVIFTFRRILAGGLSGHVALGPADPKGLTALDSRTVLVPMIRPFGSFTDQLAAFFVFLSIIPDGFDPATQRPDGTGPFAYQSFTPGQRRVFTRNPSYWATGLPYADTLTILDFPDTVSLADALITGQIHAAGTLDGPQMAQLANTPGVTALPSKTGGIIPFTMRADEPPFNDVRVRQAMRLLVDRPQLIDAALDGHGTVASDVFSPYDPDFDASLVRHTDLGQAKSLLKQAGHTDLAVTLTTSVITTGTVAMATVLAEQAKAAGVTIRLQNVPPVTFFGADYLQWTFAQDYYPSYLAQVAYSMLPGSPFNETHTSNPGYTSLYQQANATASPALRTEILHQMQRFDFEQGGYIIPAFVDSLDAYSTKIGGYIPARVDEPLSNFEYARLYFR